MKKVKYVGHYDADLPTLGIAVKPGDVIEVEDTFENVLFVLEEEIPEVLEVLEVKKDSKLKGDK